MRIFLTGAIKEYRRPISKGRQIVDRDGKTGGWLMRSDSICASFKTGGPITAEAIEREQRKRGRKD